MNTKTTASGYLGILFALGVLVTIIGIIGCLVSGNNDSTGIKDGRYSDGSLVTQGGWQDSTGTHSFCANGNTASYC